MKKQRDTGNLGEGLNMSITLIIVVPSGHPHVSRLTRYTHETLYVVIVYQLYVNKVVSRKGFSEVSRGATQEERL